jgi:glycosyltransferase involved in cell wall biosynthesis
MNICLAHGLVDGHSGSGRYIADLAGRFAEDGHCVTLVCHEYESPASSPAIEVVRLPAVSPRLWRLGHLASLASNSRSVRRALSGRQFDVLLGSDMLLLRPLRSAAARHARFIYTPLSMIAPIEIASYELGGFRGAAGVRLYAHLQRWALNACDRVVRFTPSAVAALERYYHMDLSRKALVSVYVSREFEDAASGNEPVIERPEPRELLWVGRLIKSKNVEFLLRAVTRLTSTNWILNVCSNGPERHALEALAGTLGLDDRVRFLGAVPDLPSVYRRAAMMLTASVLEQYSLTIMEGYSFGVPCIGLRPDWQRVFNSNEDQIDDGTTGYVVRDETEMAKRIDTLLTNEPLRQQFGRTAYRKKQQGFSFEAFFKDIRSGCSL